MDHDALRRTYREMDVRHCTYEKSILTGRCNCLLARRVHLGERVGIQCGQDEADVRCKKLHNHLCNQLRFTLKIGDETTPLTHGQQLRVQLGSLRGIHTVVHAEESLPNPVMIEDIDGLLIRAKDLFNDLEELPLQEIIQQVAALKSRKLPR